MFAKYLTVFTTFLASLKKQDVVCFRRLVAVLFVFQMVSVGLFCYHVSKCEHALSPVSGEVIHVDTHCLTEHHHSVETVENGFPDGEDDYCLTIGLLAHASVFVPSVRVLYIEPKEINEISCEVRARQLQIVYLSNKALFQAPKHSPPQIIG